MDGIKSKKTKILILTHPEIVDRVGGAITIAFNFSNMLADNNYDVTLSCFHKSLNQPFYKLNKNAKFVNLQYYKNIIGRESNKFKQFVDDEQPDLIIFFFGDWAIRAIGKNDFKNIPKILMIHSRPDVYFNKYSKNNLNIINKMNLVQVLLPSFYDMMKKFYNGPIVTIGNSCHRQSLIADLSNTKKKIIYLTRIDYGKGHKFLINSFAKIAIKNPDWTLDIWGQSQPENIVDELKLYIKKLGLENQIKLCGITHNPIDELKNADICVFPSYFEGFPLGLSEALSVGLPCLGIDDCSGVNELIIDGYNGFLTSRNEDKYSEKLQFLIDNKDIRIEMGKNAIKSVEQYDEQIINNKWLSVILQIINGEKIVNEEQKLKNIKFMPIKQLLKLYKNRPPLYKRIFWIKFNKNVSSKTVVLYFLLFKIQIYKKLINNK